ncbi:sensor domain-containing protein [Mycobacterium sp. 155]|uniref:sensor domain-containing protein n=1 Tax=Mycobacterium sp. 155 TaxID=1157943 RepID=UPI00036F66FF|nr:sensor domain-containing protein [Mycobacterium sp. 155]
MRVRMGVALLGVALLLGACAPTPVHDAAVVSRLDDMLVDESVVNAIMGPPPLKATHTYRAFEQWPAGYSYSPADCLAVSANAMASVYQGTRSGEMRGTLFTNDQGSTEVDEAVVAFDTAAHARDFVASIVGTWQRCSDEVLTITSAGRPPRTFTIDVPRTVGADEVTDCQSQSYTGWGTVHAMRARGDIVIDVRVTGERLDDQAVRVVNAIVDHGKL